MRAARRGPSQVVCKPRNNVVSCGTIPGESHTSSPHRLLYAAPRRPRPAAAAAAVRDCVIVAVMTPAEFVGEEKIMQGPPSGSYRI